MKLLDAFLDLLYPPKCPFCGKVGQARGICPACHKALPWTEGEQGLKTLPGGAVCAAPLWYEDLVREGILRFKFQGASAAAEPLGELIAQCAAERFSGEFDVVTWVPVSRRRLRKRGYDQARLLAEGGAIETLRRGAVVIDCSSINPIASREVAAALAEKGIHARVINICTIKPLDEEIVIEAAKACGKVITCEEHSIIGGLGEAVAAVLAEKCPTAMRRIGVNDEFGHSGPAWEVLRQFGLCADHIVEVAEDFVQK